MEDHLADLCSDLGKVVKRDAFVFDGHAWLQVVHNLALDERRRIADIILERKVVDNLKPRVTIKDKSVSFEDFAKVAAEVR